MKKVLITGSCGFLMGNLLRKMIYEKYPYQFVSIDRVSSSNKNSLYWNKSHVFYIADIKDKHIIETIFQFENPDIVIHGAEEKDNGDEFIPTNILGTKVILDACSKFNVERFIHISKHANNGFYETSKEASELFVKASGLNYNILKLSNAYGPRQSANEFIPKLINSLINDKEIVEKDWSLEGSWTHVHDISSAITSVLLSGEVDKTYSVASGEVASKLEILKKVCVALNRDYDSVCSRFGISGEAKMLSVHESSLDDIWKPQNSLTNLSSNCVDWYVKNQWFFR